MTSFHGNRTWRELRNVFQFIIIMNGATNETSYARPHGIGISRRWGNGTDAALAYRQSAAILHLSSAGQSDRPVAPTPVCLAAPRDDPYFRREDVEGLAAGPFGQLDGQEWHCRESRCGTRCSFHRKA